MITEAERKEFLPLVAYCLDERAEARPSFEGLDWAAFFAFCQKQAIAGVVFAGLRRCSERTGDRIPMPQELLFKWFALSETIRRENKRLDKRTGQAVSYFETQGFRSCVLKGQGNALMYPDPLSRTPGDVDVWLEGNKKQIVDFVHSVYPDINVQYHHMDFPLFDDVEVELHYKPSFCYNKLNNRRQQAFYARQAARQFSNAVALPSCDGKVSVPTAAFNLVFQLSHMMRHFFTQGIGLRHAIDYYYLLRQDITAEEQGAAISAMQRMGMMKFFRGLLWLETAVLGLPLKPIAVTPDENVGRLILSEMLQGGNFGKSHTDTQSANALIRVCKQLKHTSQFITTFPSETLWRPVALAWDYARKHIKMK